MEGLLLRYIIPQTVSGAAVAALLALAGKAAGNRLSRRAVRDIWRLAPLFFLLPLGIWLSGMAPGPPANHAAASWLPAVGDAALENAAGAAEKLARFPIIPAAAAFWAAGAAAYMAFRLAALARFSRMVRENSRPAGGWERRLLETLAGGRRVGLLRCKGVDGPLLFGLLKPVILLPEGEMPAGRLELALRHELVHLCAGDLWHKRLLLLMAAAHWFNPAAHFVLRQSGRLCEYACDEQVAGALDESRRREYGLAILESAAPAVPEDFASALRPGAEEMKRRLGYIMDNRQKSKSSRALAAATVAVVLAAGAALSYFWGIKAEAASPSRSGGSVFAAVERLMIEDESKYSELSFSFTRPVENGYVSRGYAPGVHEGVDFAAEEGTAILAAAGGKVSAAGFDNDNGNYIVISHGQGIQTFYAHCGRLLVKEGETVAEGQKIAEVGSTGSSTGPHCHFEMRVKG